MAEDPEDSDRNLKYWNDAMGVILACVTMRKVFKVFSPKPVAIPFGHLWEVIRRGCPWAYIASGVVMGVVKVSLIRYIEHIQRFAMGC